MHIKRKFAVVYSIIMCVIIIVVGKISCDPFISYMDMDGIFTIDREVIDE